MGEVNRVGILQSDYLDLLRRKPGSGGPTLEEETVFGAVEKYGGEPISNLCVVMDEALDYMGSTSREARLRDAVAILDHLDTLGMEVRFKNRGRITNEG